MNSTDRIYQGNSDTRAELAELLRKKEELAVRFKFFEQFYIGSLATAFLAFACLDKKM